MSDIPSLARVNRVVFFQLFRLLTPRSRLAAESPQQKRRFSVPPTHAHLVTLTLTDDERNNIESIIVQLLKKFQNKRIDAIYNEVAIEAGLKFAEVLTSGHKAALTDFYGNADVLAILIKNTPKLSPPPLSLIHI